MSTGYVPTLPKAVRFDHIKGIDDSHTKNSAMNPSSYMGQQQNNR
jgi:hypothetical protein